MKLPLFTLVHNLSTPKHSDDRVKIGEASNRPPNVRSSLLNTIYGSVSGTETQKKSLDLLIKELGRSRHVITVGLWDLGIWSGGLPRVIEAVNKAADVLTMFEVQVPIPAGMIWKKERIRAWGEQRLKRKLRKQEVKELDEAIVASKFRAMAEPIRKKLGVDYLFGLTPSHIADDVKDRDGHTIRCSLFISGRGGISLISTYQLRELAKKTQRPYEYAVAFLAVSAVLKRMNPKVKWHDPDTGCLFDYNYRRHNLVKGLKKPMIDEDCLKKIQPQYKETALALVKALDQYTNSGR